MSGRNFAQNNIDFPYPNDEKIDTAEVQTAFVTTVSDSGYVGYSNIEEELSDSDVDYDHHFVAWVPLVPGSSLRTTTTSGNERALKPSYVQEGDGINIGPGDKWGGTPVCVFVLGEVPQKDLTA